MCDRAWDILAAAHWASLPPSPPLPLSPLAERRTRGPGLHPRLERSHHVDPADGGLACRGGVSSGDVSGTRPGLRSSALPKSRLAVLARAQRAVLQRAANLEDDGRGARKHRRPRRVGDDGDEHLREGPLLSPHEDKPLLSHRTQGRASPGAIGSVEQVQTRTRPLATPGEIAAPTRAPVDDRRV